MRSAAGGAGSGDERNLLGGKERNCWGSSEAMRRPLFFQGAIARREIVPPSWQEEDTSSDLWQRLPFAHGDDEIAAAGLPHFWLSIVTFPDR